MAKAFDKNIFSATDAIEDPASDVSFVDGTVVDGHADQPHVCRAVYVGGAGDLKVTMAQGGEVIFHGVVAGSMLPIQCSRIHATDTTATNIVALF